MKRSVPSRVAEDSSSPWNIPTQFHISLLRETESQYGKNGREMRRTRDTYSRHGCETKRLPVLL